MKQGGDTKHYNYVVVKSNDSLHKPRQAYAVYITFRVLEFPMSVRTRFPVHGRFASTENWTLASLRFSIVFFTSNTLLFSGRGQSLILNAVDIG